MTAAVRSGTGSAGIRRVDRSRADEGGGEVGTGDATGKMTVQHGQLVGRGLTVQSGGQQISTLIATHALPVARPPVWFRREPESLTTGSTELALRAAGGDRVALSDLVRGTQADVWRLCAHLVDRQSADDLTQDVYARAITALPRFRGDSPVRLWLLGIARHVCVDEVRRRTRRRRIGPPPGPASSRSARTRRARSTSTSCWATSTPTSGPPSC